MLHTYTPHFPFQKNSSDQFIDCSPVDDWIISLAGAATSIIFVTTKVLSRQTRCDKTQSLSWQKCARCDKVMFVATNMCFLHNFVATKVLSWQVYFCHDKHMLVMTKHVKSLNFCHNKIMFVATKVLSWQNIFSCGKFCHNRHIFVTTKDVFCRTILLSQQKLYGSPRQWQNYTH